MRDDEDFSGKIETLRARVDELGRRAMRDREGLEWVLPEALVELLNTLEELQVAEEELRQQNEELNATRQAVETERQRYQELFEFAPDGYLVTDPNGTVQETNRAAAALLAVSQDFLVGKPLAVFVAQGGRRLFRAQLVSLQTGEQLQRVDWEVRLQPRNGPPFPAALTVAVVHDLQGTLVGLRWMIRDVTERARLLAQIQAQAQQIQHFMDAVPAGLLLLDADAHILLDNPAARQALTTLNGALLDKSEPLTHLGSQPLAEVLVRHASPLPTEIAVIEPALTSPIQRLVEQSPRIFEALAHPIGTEQTRQWVLMLSDVTHERSVQQQMQAQTRLATLGQLAAGIAHDFNNILSSVMLYTSMMLHASDLSPRDRGRIQTIHQQGRRAANLVQQILDFGRRAIMEREPLGLLPFLIELQGLLVCTLPKNIQLQLDPGRGEYVVNADPTRLQQIVMNLALNARDAMPQGGQLRFRLSRLQLTPDQLPPIHGMLPGEWVCLAVSDDGVGIPPDVLPRIFEPFFTTKEVGQGSGLGLAQVYGIVQQHEGHIGVQSRVGHGTTFTIYLPAVGSPQVGPVAAEQPVLALGHGETILVVEDDGTARQALCETLTSLGYRVQLAADGQEALALYDGKVALVISDLVMPNVSGRALYTQLEAKHAGVKMILITGYPLSDEGKELLAQGIAAWIKKPFAAEELAQTIQRVLRQV